VLALGDLRTHTLNGLTAGVDSGQPDHVGGQLLVRNLACDGEERNGHRGDQVGENALFRVKEILEDLHPPRLSQEPGER